MTLALATLQDPLRALFRGTGSFPTTLPDAGARWANAYAGYAPGAVAISVVVTPPATFTSSPVGAAVTAAASVLATALGSAFRDARAAGGDYRAVFTSKLAAAFSAFWPAVALLGPGVAGVATSPPPATLATALDGFLTAGNPPSGPRPASDDQADRMASLLHAWTRTVVVINTPAGAAALPPVLLT